MGCYGYCDEHFGFRKERDICSGPKLLSGSEEWSIYASLKLPVTEYRIERKYGIYAWVITLRF
jgi:hypothetical protein